MSDTQVDTSKRTWLIASGCAGAVGGVAAAVPLSVLSALRKAKAAGARRRVDISALKPGEKMTVEWRGKPVWIMRARPSSWLSCPSSTPAGRSPVQAQAGRVHARYAKNEHRSIKPEIFVAVGICTHLGCSPFRQVHAGPQPSLPTTGKGGFLCPCHGSTFDMAGRVFKNKPAPDNLEVPPHMYLSDTKLLIGEDKKA
jgi:ubiquinol-cytochrome c reductase iron-sulfur subunit